MSSTTAAEGLTFEQLLSFIRRWLWLFVAAVAIGGGVGFAIAKATPKKYEATSSLLFNGVNPVYDELAGLSISSSASTQGQQDTNVKLVQLGVQGAPGRETAQAVGHGLTAQEVRTSLTASPDSDTNVVSLTAVARSPTLAADIVNTYSAKFIADQKKKANASFRAALLAVNREYTAMPRSEQVGPQGQVLENRAQSIELLRQLQSSAIELTQPATIPSSPSSPSIPLDVVLGALLGLALAVAGVAIRERLDKRIKDPKDLQAIYKRPLLGTIPDDPGYSTSPEQLFADQALEPFHFILAHLRYFNVDRHLHTILVASAVPREGKTTVAYQLAAAAARSGSSAVVVEADLRRPALAARLGLKQGPGLLDVLTGSSGFEDVIQSIPLTPEAVKDGVDGGGRRLDVLVAGPSAPPNPAELVESHAMQAVLRRARELYDLVVVDTTPLHVVSDAIPLLAGADGVLVVGRMGYSDRETAERLHEILVGVNAPVLGVIANGLKQTTRVGYESEYQSASDSRNWVEPVAPLDEPDYQSVHRG